MPTGSPGDDGKRMSSERQGGRRSPRETPGAVGHAVLSRALPASIRQAVENYRLVAFAGPSEDAKEFQQHQAACKAALQHIEALMKLAAAVDAGAATQAVSDRDAASIVARAEAAVDAYANPEETGETGE